MTPHTPGPWVAVSAFLENQPNRWIVKGKAWGAPSIADCGHDGEVNACLIAAAPVMLEALQATLAYMEFTGSTTDPRTGLRSNPPINKVRAALAAAQEGGTK